MDGCATVESLIRLTLWGWARLMFGPEYKNEILETLRRADSNKSYQLDRLTFGNIAVLFRDLPDVIAASSKTEGARGKLGRNHVYPPRGKKTKYSNRLDELVAVRNSVEHDKDSYWTASSEGVLMEDLASTLRRATQLLADLASDEAIPRIATPVQEIRDRWGRLTYRLLFDDGTDFEVYFSAPIRMDCGYLYFGAGSNPRPVDPLVLELESLRG